MKNRDASKGRLQKKTNSFGGDEQTLQQTYLPREVQVAFKVLMTHWILQFAWRIAFRCVLHRCGSQDIRCWKCWLVSFYKQAMKKEIALSFHYLFICKFYDQNGLGYYSATFLRDEPKKWLWDKKKNVVSLSGFKSFPVRKQSRLKNQGVKKKVSVRGTQSASPTGNKSNQCHILFFWLRVW